MIGLVYLSSVLLDNLVYANDKVGTVSRTSDVTIPKGLIAYIDPVEGAIYEVNMNGIVTWKYKIPSKIKNSVRTIVYLLKKPNIIKKNRKEQNQNI